MAVKIGNVIKKHEGVYQSMMQGDGKKADIVMLYFASITCSFATLGIRSGARRYLAELRI